MTDLKKVVGMKISAWTSPDNGITYPVRQLSVVYPCNGVNGLCAERIKCRGEDVFNGLEIGDYVTLMFDQYGNCVSVQPVVPEPEDLVDFGEVKNK